ncbi:hypothetical protein DSC45_17090 [Streptomyces sp. YIM 130001]|uniref:acyltransferase domain-containing protein n=1 Tax=Streptomyces sp. YIM 130001 TaxID=2259644 RepID=UPI000E658E85|nr:acyltransferase domain-containing protein [Streptomyces sp. YIM 130001]RII15959.1 hypothetical protein DSC45_17090 [Streptomyces sp. YIM 130001]
MRRTPPTPDVEKWLATLAGRDATGDGTEPGRHGAAPEAVPPEEALDRMELLAVPAGDRDPVLATLPDPERSPVLWEALSHCHRTLFDASGPAPRDTVWPDAPAELGASGRYFYVHLYLLALPTALAGQRRLGVPDHTVAATFADLGAKMTAYRLAHGTGGFDRQLWAMRHFRGTLHRLGRLQFERTTLDTARSGGPPPGPDGPAHGEHVLDLHIPEDGPLSPADCDASLHAARAFHARHFPGTPPPRFATCNSWLLDSQLATYLPPTSNILHFQERFTRYGDLPVADDDILQFVFHTPSGTTDLGHLPQRTTLQRAVLTHLHTGHHWHRAAGWTRLP